MAKPEGFKSSVTHQFGLVDSSFLKGAQSFNDFRNFAAWLIYINTYIIFNKQKINSEIKIKNQYKKIDRSFQIFY